jgi:hypothetical protein
MTPTNGRSLPTDALIDEVRERRRQLLASCDNDLSKLAERIRRLEGDHPERIADPRHAPGNESQRRST